MSSAKSLTLGQVIYAYKEETGLRTEETDILSEFIPLITTACFRVSKKSFTQLRMSPLIP